MIHCKLRSLGADEATVIYRRLGVRELWTLKSDGRLIVRILEKGEWVEHTRSKLFPKLDVTWLLSFLDVAPQSKAVRALRDAYAPRSAAIDDRCTIRACRLRCVSV